MRIYFLGLIVFLGCYDGLSQSSGQLFRIVEEDRFGFIDKTGKIVIPPKFRFAGDFYENVAVARLDSGFGFINRKGEFIIKPVYDYAKDFYDGVAIVIKDSKSYFLDKKGRIRDYSKEEDIERKMCYSEIHRPCDKSQIVFDKIGWQYFGYQIINKKTSDTTIVNASKVDNSYPEYDESYYEEQYGFRDELALIVKNGSLCYVDINGNVVWKQKRMHENALHKLNLDYRPLQELNCTEFPKMIEDFEKGQFDLHKEGLVLKVFPEESVNFSDSLKGIKVCLFNNLPFDDDTIYFRHPDVFIYLQIKVSDSKWKNFESICYIRCPSLFINSDNGKDTLIKFPPRHFYSFVVPAYEGMKKATFRYSLMTNIGGTFSQEFEGSYNPSHFESLDPYVPSTLLDKLFGKINGENHKGRYFFEEVGSWCGTIRRCEEE